MITQKGRAEIWACGRGKGIPGDLAGDLGRELVWRGKGKVEGMALTCGPCWSATQGTGAGVRVGEGLGADRRGLAASERNGARERAHGRG